MNDQEPTNQAQLFQQKAKEFILAHTKEILLVSLFIFGFLSGCFARKAYTGYDCSSEGIVIDPLEFKQ